MKIEINIDDRLIASLKNTFSGKKIYLWIFAIIFVTTTIVYAAVDIPHTFNKGDVISSTQMNENFQALKAKIDKMEGVPIGTVIPFTGTPDKVPTGWLLCDGQLLNRVTYADLFDVIGINWGAGDGVNTFNLPDLRGVFLRGANKKRADQYADPDINTREDLSGQSRSEAAGDDMVGTFQNDGIIRHDHSYYATAARDGDCPTEDYFPMRNRVLHWESEKLADYGDGTWQRVYKGDTQLNSGYNETRSKNAAVHYIIKY